MIVKLVKLVKSDNLVINSLLLILIIKLLIILVIITYITHVSKNKYKIFNNYTNYIAKSKIGGRGVFSGKCYKKGEIVEISPCITDNISAFNKGILKDYVFSHKFPLHVLSLGYGSMYSHSDEPNLSYSINETDKDLHMIFTAEKDIKKDEELFISYGKTWWTSRKDKLTKID
jgi:SET domain-containing protein